jgi:hypothetical protein
MMQLASSELVDAHHTPPALVSLLVRVAPLRNVNPPKPASFVIHAHRTAPGPFVETGSHWPSMTVTAGPFTLVTSTALSKAMRFVRPPDITLPPVA